MAVWTGAGREVEYSRGRDDDRQTVGLDTWITPTYMTVSVILRYDNIDITFSETMNELVLVLVISRIGCCNGLLNGLSVAVIEKLQRVQHVCAHIILIRSKRDHARPMPLELHWLPFKSRITFKTLLLTYKCLHDLAPPYLTALLSPYCPTHSLRSLISYILNRSFPEPKSVNDPSLVQLQEHGTNYPLQCDNVRVLISLRLHSKRIFVQIILTFVDHS